MGKKTYWVVHTGEKYTKGSLVFPCETKKEAQKKLDEIRNNYNISEVDGGYME